MTNDKRFSKTKVEYKSDVNESENLMDFGFAKILSESDNIQVRIQMLCHIPGCMFFML